MRTSLHSSCWSRSSSTESQNPSLPNRQDIRPQIPNTHDRMPESQASMPCETEAFFEAYPEATGTPTLEAFSKSSQQALNLHKAWPNYPKYTVRHCEVMRFLSICLCPRMRNPSVIFHVRLEPQISRDASTSRGAAFSMVKLMLQWATKATSSFPKEPQTA